MPRAYWGLLDGTGFLVEAGLWYRIHNFWVQNGARACYNISLSKAE